MDKNKKGNESIIEKKCRWPCVVHAYSTSTALKSEEKSDEKTKLVKLWEEKSIRWVYKLNLSLQTGVITNGVLTEGGRKKMMKKWLIGANINHCLKASMSLWTRVQYSMAGLQWEKWVNPRHPLTLPTHT